MTTPPCVSLPMLPFRSPSSRAALHRAASTFPCLLAAVAAATTAAAPMALAQEVSLQVTGDSADYFGGAVQGVGDIDGDGFDDIAVGSYFAQSLRGRVEILSGRTGGSLRLHVGAAAQERFGEQIAAAGDMDGDGVPDYAVAARRSSPAGLQIAGAVRAYSGADGTLLHEWFGPTAGDQLGSSLAAAGDVNGDGYADVIAGAIRGDANGTASGLIRVYSGWDGSTLYSIDGENPHDELGQSVGGAGDVNGDGLADFIAGAIGTDVNGDRSGSAFVYSGADGTVLQAHHGASAGDLMGIAVTGLGDVDGDGYDEVAVSSYGFNAGSGGNSSGSVRVFSGLTGALQYAALGASAGDWFGQRLAKAGDVNADGIPDLIAGSYRDSANGPFAGGAYVLSGADGSTLFSVRGAVAQSFAAWSVAGAGDTDGDGIAEVIVGSLRDTTLVGEPGTATVYGLLPGSTDIACMGEPNSSGLRARLAIQGSTVASANDLTLVAEDLPVRSSVVFLNSQTFGVTLHPAIGGMPSSGNLCLAQSSSGGIGRHRPVSAGATTTAILSLDVTDVPSPGPGYTRTILAGETWYWQGWYRDNAASNFNNFTDAIVITFE